MAKQYGFYHNMQACIGCKACQVACKDKNDLPVGRTWRHVMEYGGGSWVPQNGVMVPSNVFTYYISAACMHCQKPICMESCPAGAITKRDDGIVQIEKEKCIGCRYCEWACPYGAPQYDAEAGVMTKCDLCADLVDQGERPACVAACPVRALDFGELDELRAKYGSVSAVEPLPEASLTQPALVLTPHKHAQPSGARTGTIRDEEVM